MKKLLFFVFTILLLSQAQSFAANYVYGATSLAEARSYGLTAENGPTGQEADLQDGDVLKLALVLGQTSPRVSYYILDYDGTDADDGDVVLRPDDYSTAGVWRKAKFPANTLIFESLGDGSLSEVFGASADANGTYDFAFGYNAITVEGSSGNNTAIGSNTDAGTTSGDMRNTSVGADAQSGGGPSNTAVGYGSRAYGSHQVSLGRGGHVDNTYVTNSVGIGSFSGASHFWMASMPWIYIGEEDGVLSTSAPLG